MLRARHLGRLGLLREVPFPQFEPCVVLAYPVAHVATWSPESIFLGCTAVDVGVGHSHTRWVLLVTAWLGRTDQTVVVQEEEWLIALGVAGVRPVAVRRSVARLRPTPLRLVPGVPGSRLLVYSV